MGSLICEMCIFAVRFDKQVQGATLCVNNETVFFLFQVQYVKFGSIDAFYIGRSLTCISFSFPLRMVFSLSLSFELKKGRNVQ